MNEPRYESESNCISLGYNDLSSLRRYMMRFYPLAIWNILRPHKPALDKLFLPVKLNFSFSEDEHKRWHKFFNVRPGENKPPFTYSSISGSLTMYKLVSMAGVNMKYLLHLKNEIEFFNNNGILLPDKNYYVTMKIDDLLSKGDNRFVIVFKSDVCDEDHQLQSRHKDFMFVSQCDQTQMKRLSKRTDLGRHDTSQFEKLSKRTPQWHLWDTYGMEKVLIKLPEDAGILYGKLSGDLNIVHTHKIIAKIFGFPKPFIQGYCTANYVLKHVIQHGTGCLDKFEILFIRPIFVGQSIILYHKEDQFEVCNTKGELLAMGCKAAKAGPLTLRKPSLQQKNIMVDCQQ